jgi:DNA repair protein RadC
MRPRIIAESAWREKGVFALAMDSPAPGADRPPPVAPSATIPRALARPQRPRERLCARGVSALSEAELLALLLGSGTPGRSALRIGRALSRRPPAELAAWPLARWLRVRGIGVARAAALTAAFELGRRATEGGAPAAAIRGPEDVLAQVRDLARARREHFVVLLLNARHELQCRETVSIGSLNASIVHPREVFLPAILHSAASVVLVHNHPSGDPEPARRICRSRAGWWKWGSWSASECSTTSSSPVVAS